MSILRIPIFIGAVFALLFAFLSPAQVSLVSVDKDPEPAVEQQDR